MKMTVVKANILTIFFLSFHLLVRAAWGVNMLRMDSELVQRLKPICV